MNNTNALIVDGISEEICNRVKMPQTPLVSVGMISYNHAAYVSQAIAGIVMQKCNFTFELVIGVDLCDDDTLSICKEMQERYPDIIRVLTTEIRLGMNANFKRTINSTRGRYIAFCEGDDYWIDPLKLEKQVNFLEANPSYVMVCSKIRCVNARNNDILDHYMLCNQERNARLTEITLFDLLNENSVFTLTTCLRSDKLKKICGKLPSYGYDYWIWLQLSCIGRIHKMDDITAVYRIHSGGVSQAKGFFDMRYPLAIRDALYTLFDRSNTLGALNRKQKIIVIRAIYHFIRAKKIPFSEKRWLIVKTIKNLGGFMVPFVASEPAKREC